MAMAVGPSGGDDDEVISTINTTPLIDVMLVLLVMLVITIRIQLHAINLEMPVGIPPDKLVKPEKVQIDIDDKSVVYWQGLPVTARKLDQKMSLLAAQPVQPEIRLRPNRDTRCAVFANVLSTAKRKGLSKIAVIGAKQFIR